jgi:hypothetical protein
MIVTINILIMGKPNLNKNATNLYCGKYIHTKYKIGVVGNYRNINLFNGISKISK